MKRGDLYRVRKPAGDPKKFRVYAVVSRRAVIDSRFSTVVCAPVFSARGGLSTEVLVGVAEGLKHASSLHCDALVSIPKPLLSDYVGALGPEAIGALEEALRIALAIEC